MNDPNKYSIYLRGNVKRRLIENAGEFGLSLEEYLEKTYSLKKPSRPPRDRTDESGRIGLPLHIVEGLSDLAEDEGFESVNEMLADHFHVERERRGPPSKFDVSDLAVGESREFDGVDYAKIIKYLKKYCYASGKTFDIDYYPDVHTVRVRRSK